MAKLHLLLLLITLITLLKCVTNKPIDDDYIVDNVKLVKYDDEYNSDENVKKSDEILTLYKRQIDPTLKQFPLNTVISGIEESLFQSALDVSNILQNFTNEPKDITNTDDSLISTTTTTLTPTPTIISPTTTEHDLTKRDSNQETTIPENLITQTNEQPTNTIYDHITAQTVPLNDQQPAHVVVDHVTVYVADQRHLPQIPSFDLHLNGFTHEAYQHLINAKSSSINSETTTESLLTTFSETPKPTTILNYVTNPITITTPTQQTTIVTTQTTSKTTVDELKEAEEELKEKVAEIQADPIILSARV